MVDLTDHLNSSSDRRISCRLESRAGQSRRLALTAPQAIYWSAQARSPSRVFNIASCVNITGDVRIPELIGAINQAMEHADALHVRLFKDEDGPVQLFEPNRSDRAEIGWQDFSAEPDPLVAAQAWMRAKAAIPFDPSNYPLFENSILKLDDWQYIWFGRCHHIVCDGYGLYLLAAHVADLYTRSVRGEAMPRCPFGSLVALVNEDQAYQSSDRFEVDRAYWREAFKPSKLQFELTGHQEISDLPPTATTSRIAASLAARLDLIGRVNGGSLASVILAASILAFAWLVGGMNVPINLPVMNRVGPVSKRTPGMCASLLPLQVPIVAGASYGDLLKAAANAMRAVLRHQRFSIQSLCQDLGVDFETSGHSKMMMVNIMLFDAPLQFGTCRCISENIDLGLIDNASICADGVDGSGGFRLTALTNPAIYTELTARSLHGCLTRLLETIAEDPSQCIDLKSVEYASPASGCPK